MSTAEKRPPSISRKSPAVTTKSSTAASISRQASSVKAPIPSPSRSGKTSTPLGDRQKSSVTKSSPAIGENEVMISYAEACHMLIDDLHYPESRVEKIVKLFDKNGDGVFSDAEFKNFKAKIAEIKQEAEPKFLEYDLDGSGSINLDEAATILRRPPFLFPREKVKIMLKQFDTDGNGTLDYQEFVCFYAEAKASGENMAELFDQLDVDGSGTLSHSELVKVICDKMSMEENEAKAFLDMFDENKDGEIDKAEFVGLWTSLFG